MEEEEKLPRARGPSAGGVRKKEVELGFRDGGGAE